MTTPAPSARPRGELASAEARHRIGAAVRATGMSASAIRVWERQGLVSPARSRSGYRLYSDADLSRLRHIRRMRDERLNAPGILHLLSGHRPRRTAEGQLDGTLLRRLRRERSLSLQAAARRAGLSPSFLSALERGAAGASVATLHRLTVAYGVTTLDLFSPPRSAPERPRRRVSQHERQLLTLGSGVRIEQLSVGATQLEPQLFVLDAGATSDGTYAHEGEEFLYVLDGALTVWINDRERHRLVAGDALTFPSTLPHRWRNRADGVTRLLWINTPPTF